MFDLLPGPPLNFCTSPPLEALKPNRSHSATHILMQHQHNYHSHNKNNNNNNSSRPYDKDDSENVGGGGTEGCSSTGTEAGDMNQSTNSRLSGPINSSAKHLYVSNCPGFKPAAIMRRSFRTDKMTNGHNERWTVLATETAGDEAAGDDGDSEVERFNFEGIQISYSSPSLPMLDMDSVSPPAAKLFCEASVAATAPKRRPLKHHNHQRLQRLQRPCLDFDKMQQVSGEGRL